MSASSGCARQLQCGQRKRWKEKYCGYTFCVIELLLTQSPASVFKEALGFLQTNDKSLHGDTCAAPLQSCSIQSAEMDKDWLCSVLVDVVVKACGLAALFWEL